MASALARFESFVERLLEGSLIGLFHAPLEPVEIARRVERAMEAERRIGLGVIYAPTEYTVALHPDDFAQFAAAQALLEQELALFVQRRAAERGYTLLGAPVVMLVASPAVGRRQVLVTARLAETPPAGPAPTLQVTQRLTAPPAAAPPAEAVSIPRQVPALVGATLREPFLLRLPLVRVGRALDNDLVLETPRVSRYHAEIYRQGEEYWVRDLESRNGTWVNGRRVREERLRPDDEVAFADVRLRFVLPR